MGKTEVYNRKHHEYKSLQGNNQNMEHSPWETQYRLNKPRQQGYQNKYQLSRIHITEET
jgi:hypothetical protein